jgi:hypothetical protein
MRILAATLLFCSATAAQTTTLQWVHNPANGHFYAASPPLSWTDAELLAQTYGGHLATVRNATENAWLASTFSTGLECLWIGLNDAQTEGVFVWSSGEPVQYLNWAPGEPTNGLGIEDWCHLALPWAGTQYAALWNDSPNAPTAYGYTCRGILEVSAWVVASFASFGNGCPGPTGPTPTLAGVPGGEPRLGTTARIRVAGLPSAVTVPIFVLGLSNTQDPGPPAYPLPQDLGVLGWPGCSQLVSDDAIDFAITTTGQADYVLAVPMTAGLVGFTFHAQALVLYSPSGVAVSNGVTGVVGF